MTGPIEEALEQALNEVVFTYYAAVRSNAGTSTEKMLAYRDARACVLALVKDLRKAALTSEHRRALAEASELVLRLGYMSGNTYTLLEEAIAAARSPEVRADTA